MKNYSLYYFHTTFLFSFPKSNKSLLLVLLFSLFLGFHSNAQLTTTWHKTFGEYGYDTFIDVQPTLDGNYLVLAYDNNDFWIIKLDVDGTLIWEKKYGENIVERPYAFDMRPNGGAIIAGSKGTVSDGWVVVINDVGDIEWEKSIGGSGNDSFRDVKVTSDGGFILLGISNSADGDIGANYGEVDLFVTKLDSSGGIEWTRNYGGSDEEVPVSIHQIGGHYIISSDTWSSDGDVSVYYDFQDIWLLEIDAIGNIVLDKTLGGTGFETLTDLKPTSDGGLILGGIIGSENLYGGGYKGWEHTVVKLDANQNLEWEKVIDNPLEKVIQTPDGKYLVLDIHSHVYQLNEFGEQEWEHEIILTPEEEGLTKNLNLIDDKLLVVGLAEKEFYSTTHYDGLVIQLQTSMFIPPSSPCPNDLSGFITLGEFDGSKYYISNDVSKASDAQQVAEANGGNLVVINSLEENDFIQQNISDMVYIGLNDLNDEGELVWVNGEALNYNNINPCNFCEANSDEQDFVIMQPWDGAWSFSNFYNQRKYIIEVVCDSSGGPTPTSDTTGCYFLSTFSNPSSLPIHQCVEETPYGFKWYSAETIEYFDPNVNPPLSRTEVGISIYGNVINSFQETFNPPPNFKVVGVSKKDDLAFVINESTEWFSVCTFNWQELWSIYIPGVLSNNLIEYLNISETEDEIILLGYGNNGNGTNPFIMVVDKYSGTIKINSGVGLNLNEESHVAKGVDGNYYVFGVTSILKFDTINGSSIWAAYFSSTDGYPSFIGETPDGSAIYASLKDSQLPMVAKFDATTGLTNWELDLNTILPSDRVANAPYNLSAEPTLDGGIIIGLNTMSISTGSDHKFYLAKLDQNGEVVWEQEYDESYQNYVLQLAASDGGYILTQLGSNQPYNFLKLNSFGLQEPACGANSLPDLQATNLFIDDYTNNYSYTVNETNPYDSLVFSFERENIGVGNSGNYDVGFYLSNDTTFDSNDELIYTLNNQNSHGQTSLETFETIIIPSTTSTGFYYLLGVLDNQDEVFELLENNNVAISHGFELINFGNTNSPCQSDIPGFVLLGEFSGSNYYLSEETAQPVAAQIKAEEINGYLAAINNQAENDFIANQLNEMVYIGLNDFDTEEVLDWGTNSPVNFTNFDICNFCNDNTPDMDFVMMHNWNGGWSWSSFYNSRKYIVEVPCPISLNGNPINNTFIYFSSENLKKERVIYLEKIYPNPAEEVIYTQIKSTVKQEVELFIYDTRGALVKSRKVSLILGENKIQINVNDLAKGVYSIYVPEVNRGFPTMRFVK